MSYEYYQAFPRAKHEKLQDSGPGAWYFKVSAGHRGFGLEGPGRAT